MLLCRVDIVDIPSVTSTGYVDPMGKQGAIVIAARAGDGNFEACKKSSGGAIGRDTGLLFI